MRSAFLASMVLVGCADDPGNEFQERLSRLEANAYTLGCIYGAQYGLSRADKLPNEKEALANVHPMCFSKGRYFVHFKRPE